MCESGSLLMPFSYRLQKILDFRIRKKEEQLLVVQQAQQEVTIAEQNIIKNNQEIEQTKLNQRKADFRLMEAFDKFLKHLWEKAETLEQIKVEAEHKLYMEMQNLIEREKEVKVLEKHKEKNKEAYLEEEKAIELKKLSEIAVQRHFRQSSDKKIDEEEQELLAQIKLIEGEYINEY